MSVVFLIAFHLKDLMNSVGMFAVLDLGGVTHILNLGGLLVVSIRISCWENFNIVNFYAISNLFALNITVINT